MKSLLPTARRADITFRADGRIDISARLAKLLDIAPGDVIDVVKHGDEYLLYVRHRKPSGRYEATCYKPARNGSLRAYSKALATAVLDVCNRKTLARLACGEHSHIAGTDYLALITHALNTEAYDD